MTIKKVIRPKVAKTKVEAAQVQAELFADELAGLQQFVHRLGKIVEDNNNRQTRKAYSIDNNVQGLSRRFKELKQTVCVLGWAFVAALAMAIFVLTSCASTSKSNCATYRNGDYKCISMDASAEIPLKTVTIDAERTVRIEGPIGSERFLYSVNKVVSLATDNKPIYLLINSPGGEIYSGVQMISAMTIAKSRGSRIICVVPVIAASMAFQILAHCDERYVLRYSLLLWHPAKISDSSPQTSRQLEKNANVLRKLEKPMIRDLIDKLNTSERFFYYHYSNETLWTAEMLDEAVPGFIQIVDDIVGLDALL